MAVTIWDFGKTARGEAVKAYCLEAEGMQAVFLDYGATLQSLKVKNGKGGLTDVVLGFDNMQGYEGQDAYLGATVGRMANRVGGAEFSLGGRKYELCKNDGENSLHGGRRGFDKYVWQAGHGEDYVRFSRISPDGEEGYPGNLQVSVTYRLEASALHIGYEAVSDADTIVSLTNHSYFNLNGGGTVLDTELKINAELYSELGKGVLPTGRQLQVQGTPFDFRLPKAIGRDIDAEHVQIEIGGGYDHNFVLSGREAAWAFCQESGIAMSVFTDLPGMQLYTANFLGEYMGKDGKKMGPRQAFCLETQLFPNAMNCYGFPSPVLRAGQIMQHETVYKFEVI